ncbi:HAMP domain-containing histidine kinase [Pacificimonas sp. WHA3]|uniref:histidine kinase n=1 Tax=Pacificimonas pallii TaxID=2827236 RepID=A0ABS6SGB4_9SPHN|nr:HAMP domain-containing sensor histidine kinase [Pacificimonas pallii]MBV7256921.1 HAMP domain-containing histidine kinase [Pacificimonas pallii]
MSAHRPPGDVGAASASQRGRETGPGQGSDLATQLYMPVAEITKRALRLGAGRNDQGYARFARDIAQACAHLEEVLNDLDGARKVKASATVDMRALVNETAPLFGPIAEARQISFSIAGATGPVAMVSGDQKKLRQILINLFSNALKFSDDGGQVDVFVEDGDEVVVTVRDSGPGIAKADRMRIFERFERLGSETEGRGIGLSIAASHAAASGGRLFVTDDGDGDGDGGKGGGATFVLALPKVCSAV